MPIVLDDNILIPPSQRLGPPPRVYHTVSRDTGSTTTIIDSRTDIDHVPRAQRSPVVIHQETTSYLPSFELDRRSEASSYDIHGSQRRYYAGSEPGRSRHRALSISSADPYAPEIYQQRGRHYDDGYEYHHEDGRGYNYIVAPDYHHRHRHHSRHRDERLAEAEAHDRHVRHLAQAGLAVGATAGAIGAAKMIHGRHRRHSHADYSSGSDTDHHTGRNLAGAALGVTAAGIAAHKLRKHRHRSRSRSSDSYSSDTHSDHHTGRKLAGAALGATAAGIAAHKLREHRRKSRSRSRHSRPRSRASSYSDGEHHHNKAKIAAGTAAAIGTGLAARHYMRNRSRSRSSSRSPSPKSHKGRHVAAAVLGATAAGLARHKYKEHQEEKMANRPRPVLRRSASDGSFHHSRRGGIFGRHRSPSPHKHSKLKTGLATVAAAAVAKKAMDHYQESRSRSPSAHHHRQRSRSRSGGIPKKAVATMVGAAIAGDKLYKRHKEKERKREEEMRHYGGGIEVPRGSHSSVYASPGGSVSGGGYVETLPSDASSIRANSPPPPNSSRSRSNTPGSKTAEGVIERLGGDRHDDKGRVEESEREKSKERRGSLGHGLNPEAIAFKLGQTLAGVADGLKQR